MSLLSFFSSFLLIWAGFSQDPARPNAANGGHKPACNAEWGIEEIRGLGFPMSPGQRHRIGGMSASMVLCGRSRRNPEPGFRCQPIMIIGKGGNRTVTRTGEVFHKGDIVRLIGREGDWTEAVPVGSCGEVVDDVGMYRSDYVGVRWFVPENDFLHNLCGMIDGNYGFFVKDVDLSIESSDGSSQDFLCPDDDILDAFLEEGI